MAEYNYQVRTRTLARIVGPYMLILGATLLSRQSLFADVVPTFMDDPALVLATGAFTLIAGLCIVAVHHHWSSAAACVLSIVGIIVSFKGAWLMIAPEWGADATQLIATAPGALTVAAAFEFALGVWLTFVGWFAKSST